MPQEMLFIQVITNFISRMKKSYKYIIATIVGVFLYRISRANNRSMKFSLFKSTEQLKLSALQNALINAGVKDPQLNFALAQLLFETGRFTSKSNVAALNNNYSGIKWLNKSYQNATRGTLAPANERVPGDSPINYYAKFKDINAWAVDFKRILSLKRSGNNLGSPITALTPEDYVKRLKLNNFFGGNETTYLNGLKKFLAMFK